MKTVNKLIDGFIDLQKSLGIIGENEKDTYIYAYTILFEQVLNIFIAIVKTKRAYIISRKIVL